MHKKEHKCGEVYCKTCKDYFDPDHLCYMLPVCDEADRKTDPGKKVKNDERQVYIFFDFECTQDDLIQCEAGYQSGQDSIKCVNCKNQIMRCT